MWRYFNFTPFILSNILMVIISLLIGDVYKSLIKFLITLVIFVFINFIIYLILMILRYKNSFIKGWWLLIFLFCTYFIIIFFADNLLPKYFLSSLTFFNLSTILIIGIFTNIGDSVRSLQVKRRRRVSLILSIIFFILTLFTLWQTLYYSLFNCFSHGCGLGGLSFYVYLPFFLLFLILGFINIHNYKKAKYNINVTKN